MAMYGLQNMPKMQHRWVGPAFPTSLSAVSGAPRQVAVLGCAGLEGALLIQRLEGSRPPGSLCTLNRSEQVQRDQAQAELGSVG